MTREIRRAMGLTQGEFALRLGVCESAVKKWEMRGKGKRVPSVGSLKKIRELCESEGVVFDYARFSFSETEKAGE